jgi:hypothetical protein
MTHRNVPPGDGYDSLRRLAADPSLRILVLGPFTSLSVQSIERGQVVELTVSTAEGDDADVWLSPDNARELAHHLLDVAGDADQEAER